MSIAAKESIIRDTQHESALEKIQYLEDDSRYKRVAREEGFVAEKPQFGKPLKNVHVPEGLPVHLEATLTPVNDPTMRVEWYCNGRPIQQGHRFVACIYGRKSRDEEVFHIMIPKSVAVTPRLLN